MVGVGAAVVQWSSLLQLWDQIDGVDSVDMV